MKTSQATHPRQGNANKVKSDKKANHTLKNPMGEIADVRRDTGMSRGGEGSWWQEKVGQGPKEPTLLTTRRKA